MASEAVKDLDNDLRQKAFETILSKMLDAQLFDGGNKRPKSKARAIKAKPKSKKKTEHSEIEAVTTKLIQGINRTKYSQMFELKKTLDRALYVLQIAKDDMKIDGLTPTQIATILTETFRLTTTNAAAGMALMDARQLVDRKPITIQGGAGFIYFLMHPGEKYLQELLKNTKKSEE